MSVYTKEVVLSLIKKFVQENKDPVLEILGPTASGKTGFSIDVAKRLGNTEIISVDSRQVYRAIDIASAKITESEMQGIPHYGLDLVSPDQAYSVYDFQQYAFQTLEAIHERNHIPILCGGTMLWLDAVSENYQFSAKGKKSSDKGDPLWPVLKIGLHWDRSILYERINKRAEQLFEQGMIEETARILEQYPALTRSAFMSIGYPDIAAYLEGKCTKSEALDRYKKRTRNYAKRQLTWWRGRKDIVWVQGQ